VDSRTATARSRSSDRPHLHAAHWKISSVVPVNWPSTRGSSQLSHRGSSVPPLPTGRLASERWTAAASGMTWLGLALSGRGSQVERCTWATQAASPGREAQEPTGRSAKYPPLGGGRVATPPGAGWPDGFDTDGTGDPGIDGPPAGAD